MVYFDPNAESVLLQGPFQAPPCPPSVRKAGGKAGGGFEDGGFSQEIQEIVVETYPSKPVVYPLSTIFKDGFHSERGVLETDQLRRDLLAGGICGQYRLKPFGLLRLQAWANPDRVNLLPRDPSQESAGDWLDFKLEAATYELYRQFLLLYPPPEIAAPQPLQHLAHADNPGSFVTLVLSREEAAIIQTLLVDKTLRETVGPKISDQQEEVQGLLLQWAGAGPRIVSEKGAKVPYVFSNQVKSEQIFNVLAFLKRHFQDENYPSREEAPPWRLRERAKVIIAQLEVAYAQALKVTVPQEHRIPVPDEAIVEPVARARGANFEIILSAHEAERRPISDELAQLEAHLSFAPEGQKADLFKRETQLRQALEHLKARQETELIRARERWVEGLLELDAPSAEELKQAKARIQFFMDHPPREVGPQDALFRGSEDDLSCLDLYERQLRDKGLLDPSDPELKGLLNDYIFLNHPLSEYFVAYIRYRWEKRGGNPNDLLIRLPGSDHYYLKRPDFGGISDLSNLGLRHHWNVVWFEEIERLKGKAIPSGISPKAYAQYQLLEDRLRKTLEIAEKQSLIKATKDSLGAGTGFVIPASVGTAAGAILVGGLGLDALVRGSRSLAHRFVIRPTARVSRQAWRWVFRWFSGRNGGPPSGPGGGSPLRIDGSGVSRALADATAWSARNPAARNFQAQSSAADASRLIVEATAATAGASAVVGFRETTRYVVLEQRMQLSDAALLAGGGLLVARAAPRIASASLAMIRTRLPVVSQVGLIGAGILAVGVFLYPEEVEASRPRILAGERSESKLVQGYELCEVKASNDPDCRPIDELPAEAREAYKQAQRQWSKATYLAQEVKKTFQPAAEWIGNLF